MQSSPFALRVMQDFLFEALFLGFTGVSCPAAFRMKIAFASLMLALEMGVALTVNFFMMDSFQLLILYHNGKREKVNSICLK